VLAVLGRRLGIGRPAAVAVVAVGVVAAVACTVLAVVATSGGQRPPGAGLAALPARLNGLAPPRVTDAGQAPPPAGTAPPGGGGPAPGSVAVYAGLGAWVDTYDYVPASGGTAKSPAVQPGDVDAMAAAGIRTIFIQASRPDATAASPLVDPSLLAEFVLRAHARGMRVVGWYLPELGDVDADLARLKAIANFRVLNHGLDGVALDIEDTTTVPDLDARNQALVDLSTRLRAALPGQAIGAVVLPPVLTEVVNPAYWPAFPWAAVSTLFDVWLPMSYWTYRKADSGYHDGYTYDAESIRRLRLDLGQPAAVVHAIGGLAAEASPAELDAFVRSLVDSGAIGGSVYDWASSPPAERAQLADAFAAGPGAGLARPP
jgi:hypothetical protein